MLLKLYNKSKLWFALGFIIAYCLLMSVGDSVSELIQIQKSVTVPVAAALSALLLLFLHKNSLLKEYGLAKSQIGGKKMLFYLPVFAMLSANLWFGTAFNLGALETVLYIIAMLFVGLLEELIFRGLLFGAMYEASPKAAVIVSSVTFGIGHIINLVNGSGAGLLPSILQVIYATAAGFMFVMIYIRTKSLIGCILAHGIFNSLSIFSSPLANEPQNMIISAIILTLITASYGLYLAFIFKENK